VVVVVVVVVVCLSVFSCAVWFVSISQLIGCEYRLQYDLYCVECGVKLYSNQSNLSSMHLARTGGVTVTVICRRICIYFVLLCFQVQVCMWKLDVSDSTSLHVLLCLSDIICKEYFAKLLRSLSDHVIFLFL